MCRLVKAHPNKAMPWYIAGCYYYVTKQFTSARHYFGKATSLDRNFAPAWVAFAQAFACQDGMYVLNFNAIQIFLSHLLPEYFCYRCCAV